MKNINDSLLSFFRSRFVCVTSLIVYYTIYDATITCSAKSMTANGHWGSITEFKSYFNQSTAIGMIPDQDVCLHFMCTPSNLTWIPSYKSVFYNNITGCEALIKNGIKAIYFHGDSYMRQIYAAMLITLNGNYETGSLANPLNSPGCLNRKQFNEKGCGTRDLNHYGIVCNNQVILDPLLHGFHDLKPCSSTNGSVILWSFGNYKLTKYGK